MQQMHRPHKAQIEPDGVQDIHVPLFQIAPDASENPDIGIHIHIDLQIRKIADFRNGQQQKPVNDDDGGRGISRQTSAQSKVK